MRACGSVSTGHDGPGGICSYAHSVLRPAACPGPPFSSVFSPSSFSKSNTASSFRNLSFRKCTTLLTLSGLCWRPAPSCGRARQPPWADKQGRVAGGVSASALAPRALRAIAEGGPELLALMSVAMPPGAPPPQPSSATPPPLLWRSLESPLEKNLFCFTFFALRQLKTRKLIQPTRLLGWRATLRDACAAAGKA